MSWLGALRMAMPCIAKGAQRLHGPPYSLERWVTLPSVGLLGLSGALQRLPERPICPIKMIAFKRKVL